MAQTKGGNFQKTQNRDKKKSTKKFAETNTYKTLNLRLK